MARTWLTPSSACIVTASGSVATTTGYAWFQLVAACHNAACGSFYHLDASASNQLVTLVASASTTTDMVGPFKVGRCVYVRVAGTGASATVAKA